MTRGYNWIEWSVNDKSLPVDAVLAGYEDDKTPIYVGRARHDGDLMPAKIIPSKQKACVTSNGLEEFKSSCEILCGQGFRWIKCNNGSDIPSKALLCGSTECGEPLYIGRTDHEGSLTPGKIHRKVLNISFGGTDHISNHYEVLVGPQRWIEQIQCGKKRGSEELRQHLRFNTTKNFQPQAATNKKGRFQNIQTVQMVDGQPLDGAEWLSSSSADLARAIEAGHDSGKSPIYVGRAYHEDNLLPASVIPAKQIAYVCHNKQEFPKHFFEVLCGGNVSWVPSAYGSIPPYAVFGGITSSGERLYIGRARYKESLIVGKIQGKRMCFSFEGSEVTLEKYEVLVENCENLCKKREKHTSQKVRKRKCLAFF